VHDWIFCRLKAPIHRGKKTLMLSSRDLDRLKARTQALRQSVGAPFISIDVWHQGQKPPEQRAWQLRIMIERRD
tara:strand:- start:320 stop:541 length:222 start_codon:yes stop_codon:yes gene_type:complete